MFYFAYVFQAWLDALEEHSAYSTHYCSPEQGSMEEGDEEEGGGMSLEELTDSLQVAVNNIQYINTYT